MADRDSSERTCTWETLLKGDCGIAGGGKQSVRVLKRGGKAVRSCHGGLILPTRGGELMAQGCRLQAGPGLGRGAGARGARLGESVWSSQNATRWTCASPHGAQEHPSGEAGRGGAQEQQQGARGR